MQDLTIELDDRPGTLAELGEKLGQAGVSVEGGGAWVVDGQGAAHFLVADGVAAERALTGSGIRVKAIRDVVLLRLKQDEAGQLGKICRRMSEAGVNIEVLYSDHEHQLVLVAAPVEAASAVARQWMDERAAGAGRPPKPHRYATRIRWTGNDGTGTRDYRSYRRDHEIVSGGKPVVAMSSDPAFRGDPSRYNPEELLVASLASCHMLWYLHLCAVNQVIVVAYEDEPTGVMLENVDGAGKFSEVTLRPVVTLAPGSNPEKALALHAEVHRFCFIARSVNFPVHCEPVLNHRGTENTENNPVRSK